MGEETTTNKTEKETSSPSISLPSEAPVPVPVSLPNTEVTKASPSVTYNSIDRFSFDAGGYSDKFVTLYLPLEGVGSIENRSEQIKCGFEKDGFDLIVLNLNEKNYRIKRNNLEHDIVPEQSKYIVKANKVIVKLAKVKGEYGFDSWTKLTDPKRKEKKTKSSDDPQASLMNMMKDMYDSGDDNMRKMIGETMMKQRNGQLNNDMKSGFGGDLESD